MPELKKPEKFEKPDADKTGGTNTAEANASAMRLASLKEKEQNAVAKLEEIKKWPKDQQEGAVNRTNETLSQIREKISALESSK